MKKVGVCGHFGGGHQCLNGQTVKTKIIAAELKKQLGNDEVETVDTYGGAKKTLFHLMGLRRLAANCKNVIILPAHNGLRILAPFLAFLNRFYQRKIHYIVIGGWMPKFVSSRKLLAHCLKRFDYIYVETTTMKRMLEKQGFRNIVVMPNCKELRILREDQLKTDFSEPYPLCTFSRVMEEKGIGDAVQAVQSVNRKLGRTAFSLDIYGQVDGDYVERFEKLKQQFPDYIRYRGCVPFDQSVDTLKKYYALLFPTRFYTEGIPGTIIDAYAAGIPVIASRWESFADVVDDGVVGIGYQFGSFDALEQVLFDLYGNPCRIIDMKKKCLRQGREYQTDVVIEQALIQRL